VRLRRLPTFAGFWLGRSRFVPLRRGNRSPFAAKQFRQTVRTVTVVAGPTPQPPQRAFRRRGPGIRSMYVRREDGTSERNCRRRRSRRTRSALPGVRDAAGGQYPMLCNVSAANSGVDRCGHVERGRCFGARQIASGGLQRGSRLSGQTKRSGRSDAAVSRNVERRRRCAATQPQALGAANGVLVARTRAQRPRAKRDGVRAASPPQKTAQGANRAPPL